jgi:hypothetical protein
MVSLGGLALVGALDIATRKGVQKRDCMRSCSCRAHPFRVDGSFTLRVARLFMILDPCGSPQFWHVMMELGLSMDWAPNLNSQRCWKLRACFDLGRILANGAYFEN